MDIHQFKKDFDDSGMTQKDYGNHIGMSPSMVHYYLKKSTNSSLPATTNSFKEMSVSVTKQDKYIIIRTEDGLQISIPI